MLKEINDRILYSPPDHEVDQPCLYAIIGASHTLMIDGGVSEERAKKFQGELRARTGRGADIAAVTHWHWDHTFGLAGVDAPVLAHRNTAEHLRRMAGYASWSDEVLEERIREGSEIENCAMNIRKVYPGDLRKRIRIRQPDIVFDGTVELNLGGLTCELSLLPPVHTNDSVSIYVREEGVLLIGDATGQNSYDRPAHYDTPSVVALMRRIRGSGACVVAESHSEPVGTAGFFSLNGILETAAQGVLNGNKDARSLMEHLKRACGSELPCDTGEIVELFINGAQMPRFS
jgi:glyoxylase-like metal-dependent hydrolase (beta-lactamase superfamily II)